MSAPEIFQRAMTEIFEDTERCEVIVDDLLVWDNGNGNVFIYRTYPYMDHGG